MEWYWWMGFGYMIVALLFWQLSKKVLEEEGEEIWKKVWWKEVFGEKLFFPEYPRLFLLTISLLWLPDIILGSIILFLKKK